MSNLAASLVRAARRAGAMLVLALAAPVVLSCQNRAAGGYPAVYRYTYEYNTEDLIEDHFIVLDRVEGAVVGWYYGTSDEFDAVREGYRPGFFVAPMEGLRILPDGALAFSLRRPASFFTAPVPLRYRSEADLPPGSLDAWPVELPDGSRDYAGTMRGDELVLTTERVPRVFRRIETPR